MGSYVKKKVSTHNNDNYWLIDSLFPNASGESIRITFATNKYSFSYISIRSDAKDRTVMTFVKIWSVLNNN